MKLKIVLVSMKDMLSSIKTPHPNNNEKQLPASCQIFIADTGVATDSNPKSIK